jgi:hypothetical protein
MTKDSNIAHVCNSECIADQGETVIHKESAGKEQIYPVAVISASCATEAKKSLA